MRNNSDRLTSEFHLWKETGRLLHVSLPSVAVQVSLYIIFPQAASIVGRSYGTEALGAISLGVLVGNLTILSIIIGCLSAADTLMPRAYGSDNFPEMGRLAIRGAFVCLLCLLPMIVLLSQIEVMEWILVKLGQDSVVSRLTASWIRIFLLGAPANMLFRVSQRFLVAQRHPWPPVLTCLIPCFIVNPLLLKFLVPVMGLNGSAWAVAITMWLYFGSLLLYLRFVPGAYEPETWSGLSWHYIRESLAIEPLSRFFSYSLGGVAALSEWWFWETQCLIAGSFGVIQLCAHTIAYNLIPLCFMIPIGMQIGLTVRIGNVIAYDPGRAKLMAAWTMALTATIGALLGATLFWYQDSLIRIFTRDDIVIQETKMIWGRVCYYIFVLYIFGINAAILKALGLQWRMAYILVVFLWFITLPVTVWFSIVQDGGLLMQWTILPICYTFFQGALFLGYAGVDWEGKSKSIRESANIRALLVEKDSIRSSSSGGVNHSSSASSLLPPTEQTALLSSSGGGGPTSSIDPPI